MMLSTVVDALMAFTDGSRFAASQCEMRKVTITAWYLLLTDIDDRKKAEEALRSKRAQFEPDDQRHSHIHTSVTSPMEPSCT